MFKLDGLGDKEEVVTGEQTDEEEALEGDLECLVEMRSDCCCWDVDAAWWEGDITGDSTSFWLPSKRGGDEDGDSFCFLCADDDSIEDVEDEEEDEPKLLSYFLFVLLLNAAADLNKRWFRAAAAAMSLGGGIAAAAAAAAAASWDWRWDCWDEEPPAEGDADELLLGMIQVRAAWTNGLERWGASRWWWCWAAAAAAAAARRDEDEDEPAENEDDEDDEGDDVLLFVELLWADDEFDAGVMSLFFTDSWCICPCCWPPGCCCCCCFFNACSRFCLRHFARRFLNQTFKEWNSVLNTFFSNFYLKSIVSF